MADLDRIRCDAEIADIEALLRVGHLDIQGLVLALSDWSQERRLIQDEIDLRSRRRDAPGIPEPALAVQAGRAAHPDLDVSDKRSRWFTGVPEAAEYVAGINGARDVYVGLGLSGKDYGPTRRCVSDEITGISGLASDLDLASEVHSKKALPRTVEQALSIVPSALPPTIVILTGNGVHCWWLLKEPYMFENEEDRRNAAASSRDGTPCSS